jgi:ubiquitin-protein ligase
MDLRQQRIENEWALLQRMAEANPALLVIQERQPDEFQLTLRQTPAMTRLGDQIQVLADHQLRLAFSRFFPTVPIEGYLLRPVFHPNVHPDTGFVCLWGRFSLRDTVVEALCQLQRVLSCTLFSESADHVMQPEALRCARLERAAGRLPLTFTPLAKPPGWQDEREFRKAPGRKRLS